MAAKPELKIRIRVEHKRTLETKLLEQIEQARLEYEQAKGPEKAEARERYLTAMRRFSAIAQSPFPDVGGI